MECPVCHRMCGTCDTRERTWRHLDIWQYETIVHCALPRADCPKDGVHAVKMPWEVRPNSHFTALFKAQVISDGALWHERDAGRAAAARDSPRAYGTCWARP